MHRPERFRGQSGKAYEFRNADAGNAWFRGKGLALFASVDGHGWRIIRIAELRGVEDDIQPLWAQRDAERYGAETVLVLDEADAAKRRAIRNDLEAGLSPLWTDRDRLMAA